MTDFPRIVERTLKCDTAANRFEEGPIDLEGAEIASVEVSVHPSSPTPTWASAEAEIVGGVVRDATRAFASAQSIDTTTKHRRNLGDSTVGVAADRYLDATVDVAEANVWLLFTFHLTRSRP